MMIVLTTAFAITTAIIYIPLWLPILMACLSGNYYILFYMFFLLLSFPLDLFFYLLYRNWFLRVIVCKTKLNIYSVLSGG